MCLLTVKYYYAAFTDGSLIKYLSPQPQSFKSLSLFEVIGPYNLNLYYL